MLFCVGNEGSVTCRGLVAIDCGEMAGWMVCGFVTMLLSLFLSVFGMRGHLLMPHKVVLT